MQRVMMSFQAWRLASQDARFAQHQWSVAWRAHDCPLEHLHYLVVKLRKTQKQEHDLFPAVIQALEDYALRSTERLRRSAESYSGMDESLLLPGARIALRWNEDDLFDAPGETCRSDFSREESPDMGSRDTCVSRSARAA